MAAVSPTLLAGPIEVGAIATSFLLGCVAIQTYVYYIRFPADPLITKILVASVVIVEFAHLLSVGAGLWQATIEPLVNPAPLSVFPYSADIIIALTIVISFCVQSFFALRLLRLSGGRVLPLICLAMSTLSAVSGFVVTAHAFAMTSLVDFMEAQFSTLTLSLTAGAVCDLMITAALTYNLMKMRTTSFGRTSRLIDVLILWTIETGLAPCICALAVVACFAAMQENYIWEGIYAVLAGIYANSLLAILNSRSSIRERYIGGVHELHPTTHQEPRTGSRQSTAIVINITGSAGLDVRGDRKETVEVKGNFVKAPRVFLILF
ncbi:hypothetical protein BV22DRAFT_1126309 [Leucogyrophana mollusca]|uniref:Uncharacterized protein n=1 Tax=Leucogyrophana mollusca TaxID=85980 RepID=A0ACB8BTT8_9AGAM|nr:hypothetical protein BV22DRAFT_1126309 [Leucogyrophana mollusca]